MLIYHGHPSPFNYGLGWEARCKCEPNFTCRACLDACAERNIADRNTLGPGVERINTPSPCASARAGVKGGKR